MKLNHALAAIFLGLQMGDLVAALEQPPQEYVLRFGGQQYALAPDTPLLVPGDNFTMMGWFYWEEAPEPGAILMGQLADPWNGDPGESRLIQTRFDGLLELIVHNGSTRYFLAGPMPPVGQWVHVAGVLDSGTMKLFVNGAEVGSTGITGSPYTHVTRFSVGSGSTEEPAPAFGTGFSGYVKQVSVWDRALDATEISSAATSHVTGASEGLVAYWKLDDPPESLSAADSGTNGLNLSLDQRFFAPSAADHRPLQYPQAVIENPYFEVFEQDLPESASHAGTSPQDVYVMDLDGDGLKDLVTTNVDFDDYTELPLRAYKNDGDLSFSEITASKIGEVNVVLGRVGRVGDFNDDGADDLLIVDTGPDIPPFPGRQNTLLLGDLDGGMLNASTTNLPSLSDVNHALDIGDIDLDGDLDAFAGQQGIITDWTFEKSRPEVLVNNGEAGFSLQNERLPDSEQLVQSLAVAFTDIERDGALDALIAMPYDFNVTPDLFGQGTLVMLRNDGSGHFSLSGPGEVVDNEFYAEDGIGVHYIVTADVDNDGFLDLIAAYHLTNYDGMGLWLFRNNQDGSFTLIENAFESNFFDVAVDNWWLIYLRLGDFNNDGWIDVFAEGQYPGDYLFINNGDLSFTNMSQVLTPKINVTFSSNILDVDNDGRLDIVAVSEEKLIVVRNARDIASDAPPASEPSPPLPGNFDELEADEALLWQDGSNAYEWDVQIATDPSFSNVVFERHDFTGLSITPDGLLCENQYYWRVRGENTTGFSAWSSIEEFSYLGGCEPPFFQDGFESTN